MRDKEKLYLIRLQRPERKVLGESTPETHSSHATYQGLQWSVLLQGVLERGWRVGSVVHGVLLIWGDKPATGRGGSAGQRRLPLSWS